MYETIDHDALSYSLNPSIFKRLVYLEAYKNYVRLGFNFGSHLPDPDYLLVGAAQRLRHVKTGRLTSQDNQPSDGWFEPPGELGEPRSRI